jgi:hypothetical protein
MRFYVRRKRPLQWSQRTRANAHPLAAPFWAVEWFSEWLAYLLSNWTFLEVLDHIQAFGVIVAVVFYFSESGDRIKQKHYQAWQVINTSQGKGGNGGRIEALQELNADHVALVGVDISGGFLQGLRLQKGNLSRANLNAADVRNATLVGTDFSGANLRFANFRECDCARTSFRGATLDDADLYGANLTAADLGDATLENTDLRNADLRDIRWQQIAGIKTANIAGVRNAPEGFVSWALSKGAIQSPTDAR